MSSRCRALMTIGVGAGTLLALVLAGLFGGVRLNLTPSYPMGIWRIEPLDRDAAVGDLVFICPPETAAFASAFERGYIGRGLCPGGTGPLIKTVAATTGQRVAIAGSVSVDGQPLEHSTVRGADTQGSATPVFLGGTVPVGHLYLHSDYSGSYDSRYFGPISAEGLLGLAQPVLTITP